ncbi:14640_t:CDS:2, partial [Acaulospora colombiana]
MLSGTAGSASAPRSKAGCWTCRIRQGCDEQQDDNGSCQACVRLDIECLGWGQRRPDWCRDKDKLTEYKLRLKRKL